MLTSQIVGEVVMREIETMLGEDTGSEDHQTESINADRHLHELDINSLMLARLLIQLEDHFGVDPFVQGNAVVSDVRSVNDLITAYCSALAV